MDMDGTWLRVKPYEDRYRYNHKELTKGLGWYAYGARYYDAAVGRFTGVDPIADKFAWVTTYKENAVHVSTYGGVRGRQR
jgi:RHS repeat-associated protein